MGLLEYYPYLSEPALKLIYYVGFLYHQTYDHPFLPPRLLVDPVVLYLSILRLDQLALPLPVTCQQPLIQCYYIQTSPKLFFFSLCIFVFKFKFYSSNSYLNILIEYSLVKRSFKGISYTPLPDSRLFLRLRFIISSFSSSFSSNFWPNPYEADN